MAPHADLIVRNAKIATVDREQPQAQALAVAGNRFIAVGDESEVMQHQGRATRVIDAGGRRVIPGLIDRTST